MVRRRRGARRLPYASSRVRPAVLAPSRRALDNATRIVDHRPPNVDGRPAMTRSELCARITAATSLSKADADAAIGALLSAIADALARGESVTIAGFGKFTTRDRPARTGRNSPDRRSRRHRRVASAGVQGRQGPARRSEPIARRAPSRPKPADRNPLVTAHPPPRTGAGFSVSATDSMGCTGREIPVLPHRLHPVDRRARPRDHRLPTIPLMQLASGSASAWRRRNSGTFGAGTIIDVWSGSASMPCGCSSGSPDP